ncbi:L-histidine N(alpha)-methyltransferase [Actinomadura fibrosa]|uniref:L-histidine N(Alpha)-methyltransferase n=1 Tax=Actinomadura fibrosa TaxID=111802 RepID=A0ABW2XKZ1_9ACTN|nr:L-histidine N(alpha)-methyltransferase [Actinomadura fibrosa]
MTPRADFYRTYSAAQVDAIAEALGDRAEFPYELTYLGDGSEMWHRSEVPSGPERAEMLGDFDTLLTRHAERLRALAPSSPVQVVDLGPGTARPVGGLIRHLLDESCLSGYRAIDISAEILGLAGERLREDFPDQAERFEFCRGDFTGPDLARVLPTPEGPGHDDGGPARLVILAGGTLYNFAEPDRVLRHVRRAMSDRDVLVLTLRIDTGVDRPPFMDEVSVGGPYKPQQLAGLDLLGIDRSWYVPETGFDRVRGEVFVRVRFVEPVTVDFGAADGRRAVAFQPGDTVLVWRYLYEDAAAVADRLARGGLRVRLFEHGRDRQVVLVAATPSGEAPEPRVRNP